MSAIVKVLERIRLCPGRTTIATDSKYCINGFRAGQHKQRATFNDDLWELFFLQVTRLQGQVKLVKVKSHLKLLDAVQGHILLKDLAGNALADQLAKQAAEQAAIPEKVAESVEIGKAQAFNMLNHLVVANLEYVRQLEAAGFRDPHRHPKEHKPKQKRSRTPTIRGHIVKAITKGRWRCTQRLSVRTSLLAHRWPPRCSGVVRWQQ